MHERMKKLESVFKECRKEGFEHPFPKASSKTQAQEFLEEAKQMFGFLPLEKKEVFSQNLKEILENNSKIEWRQTGGFNSRETLYTLVIKLDAIEIDNLDGVYNSIVEELRG